jgi:hypothetical protein
MSTPGKDAVKQILGQIPFTAELYWLVRQRGGPIQSRFSLKHLHGAMPELVAQASALRQNAPKAGTKKIFVFATLHFWIEHAAVMGLALAAQGHNVTLGFLPYGDWQKPVNLFDLRRQNIYARKVLEMAAPVMNSQSLLPKSSNSSPLAGFLAEAVEQVTIYDTQYTLQVEEVDTSSAVYKLRYERNSEAARAMVSWLQAGKPDLLIVPNGTIQELGVAYRVARELKIPVVTYEFGDQRQRIWLAQNGEVMRQETDAMWAARGELPVAPGELERLHALFAARQRGALWENFARPWQDTPALGGEQARAALGLDNRPLVLLATNVLGDSLTLGRNIFSRSMAEWISRTVQYFAGRPDVQLVIRVHPGEVLTHGQSMASVVREVLPRLPEHIRLIGPKEKVNTYDLVDVADLGLVYTTTVGMEAAMNGLPVIVAGQTHYRGRGFTLDPDSWVTYFKILGQVLDNPQAHRLSRAQVERAWEYAYRFFFEFPRPFPWHLVRMWEDYKIRPLADVLSPQGLEQYGDTFRYLTGEPLDWKSLRKEDA